MEIKQNRSKLNQNEQTLEFILEPFNPDLVLPSYLINIGACFYMTVEINIIAIFDCC